jgi:phosphoribosylanthranilate isomerase
LHLNDTNASTSSGAIAVPEIMFRIKICGITNTADAEAVGGSLADAVGLNFYPQSRRFITVSQAESVVAALPPRTIRVGLFVNATDDEVCQTCDHLQLDLIQLHGNEPPEYLLGLGGRPVLRAFRLGPSGIDPILDYVEQCRTLNTQPQALLIDAHQPGAFGGTGKTADWGLLAAQRDRLRGLPLVLAGGLTADNVAEAIEVVRPDAVDTCSGVESAPGVKNSEQVTRFCHAAAKALGNQTGST